MSKEEIKLMGEEKIKFTTLVVFLLSCLEKGGFFKDHNSAPTKDDVTFLLEKCLLLTTASNENVQSVFYSQGTVDKSQLWEMPTIPVKEFALGVFPDFVTSRYLQNTKSESTKNVDGRADVILGYHKGRMFLQSLRDLKVGNKVNLQNVVGAGSSLEAMGQTMPLQMANMISFKCAGKDCTLSFPLPEKTSENVIVCPLDECGTETNIWGRRKRIVELRRDHEAARGKIEGISGAGVKGDFVKGINEGVQIIKSLIDEWDEFVFRPNKDLISLEQDLTKAILLKHIESEQAWLKSQKWG